MSRSPCLFVEKSHTSRWTKNSCTRRPVPTRKSLSTSQICKVGNVIFKVLRDAYQKGEQAQAVIEKQINALNAARTPREDKIAVLEDKVLNIADRTRRTKAAEFFFGLVGVNDDTALFQAENPGFDNDMCRFHIALELADTLQRQFDEDDIAWIDRLKGEAGSLFQFMLWEEEGGGGGTCCHFTWGLLGRAKHEVFFNSCCGTRRKEKLVFISHEEDGKRQVEGPRGINLEQQPGTRVSEQQIQSNDSRDRDLLREGTNMLVRTGTRNLALP